MGNTKINMPYEQLSGTMLQGGGGLQGATISPAVASSNQARDFVNKSAVNLSNMEQSLIGATPQNPATPQPQAKPTEPTTQSTQVQPTQGVSPVTATSQNPATQDMLNKIKEQVLTLQSSLKNISPESTQSISDVNKADADTKALMSEARQALTDNRLTDFADTYQRLQEANTIRDQKVAETYNKLITERAELDKLALPSVKEQELKQQLAEIRKNAELGAEQELGIGRPLALSVGRSERVLKQGAILEKNLIERLGIEQDFRKAQIDAKAKGLESAFQDVEFFTKINDRQEKREQDVLDFALKLDTEKRNRLADTLELMQGKIDPTRLTPEEEQVLDEQAKSLGISSSVLKKALQVDYDRTLLETKVKEAGLRKTLAEISPMNRQMVNVPGAGNVNLDAVALANQFASSGKLPSSTDLKSAGTSFGQVATIAKSLPKQPGTIVDVNTGVKPDAPEGVLNGYGALYSAIKLAGQLKDLDEERMGGLVAGTLGKVFGSEDQQRYVDLRDQIIDLLARARTGAALTVQEEEFYGDMLPGRFDEPLTLGADSSVRIDNFINNLTSDINNKTRLQGWAITGLSTVNIGGNEYKIGDVIEVNGVQGRVLPDGTIATQ